jgi:hypothetical protein
MAKKCPPGVFCIENMSLLLCLILAIIAAYVCLNINKNYSKEIIVQSEPTTQYGMYPRPSSSFSNVYNDVLMNPNVPPLRDNRVFNNTSDPRGIPINISTTAVDSDYRQVGILTRVGGHELILPLIGRPLMVARDKWNFYTMKDSNSMIKLPITFKGKSCTNEYGCDNLYNGDNVYVEGYNDLFKVTVYDTKVMKYIPYL